MKEGRQGGEILGRPSVSRTTGYGSLLRVRDDLTDIDDEKIYSTHISSLINLPSLFQIFQHRDNFLKITVDARQKRPLIHLKEE